MPALHIESDEAYRLIRELADQRGESMERVIIDLARNAISTDQNTDITPDIESEPTEKSSRRGLGLREDRTQYWLERGRALREQYPDLVGSQDIDAYLYDEWGLPK